MRRKIFFIGAITLLISINFLIAQNPHVSVATTGLGYIPKIYALNVSGNDELNNSVIYQNGSNNIGIGTTSIYAKLHLYVDNSSTSLGTQIIEQDGTGDCSIQYSLTSTANWIMGIDNSNSDAFQLSGSNAFGTNDYLTILSSGNVGIGTTAPNNILQVKDLINFNNTLYNTSLGYQAGNGITSGTNNTFLSYRAGYSNTEGDKNTFLGQEAGYNNTTMQSNVAVGYRALFTQSYDNVDVGHNVAVGNEALYNTNSTGGNTGINNTALGYQAGQAITTGINNIYIGSFADADANYSGSINIGGPDITASDIVYCGSTSVSSLKAQQSWSTYASDRRVKNNVSEDVSGIDFIKLLRPVTYNIDIHKVNSIYGYPTKKDSLGNVIGIDTMYWEGKYDVEKIRYSGFISQEVDSAAQIVGYDFSGVDKTGPLMSLRYAEFVVPLVKAVQELILRQDSLISIIATMKGASERFIGGNNNPSTDIVLSGNSAILYQNMPNPFGDGTIIKYFVPENSNSASIIFYDEFGTEIKNVELPNKGVTAELNLSTLNLASGMYAYSLIVNGNVIDTKKMIKSN
jgi:trimeric autotransporter adhesin